MDKTEKSAYRNSWIAEKLDRVNLTMPKGKKEQVKEVADKVGLSLNAYINQAIDEKMEKDIVQQYRGVVSGKTLFYFSFFLLAWPRKNPRASKIWETISLIHKRRYDLLKVHFQAFCKKRKLTI